MTGLQPANISNLYFGKELMTFEEIIIQRAQLMFLNNTKSLLIFYYINFFL